MKQSKNVCDLNSCFLCQAAIADWIPAISVHKTNITIKKGQLLFKEGAPVKGIYFVYSGHLKVHKRWDAEKEIILRFAKKGDIVGHLGLGTQLYYPVSATAIDEVTVCYVDMPFFESTLNVNHQLVIKLMRFFANELQESEKRMRNLVHMSVKGRVSQALILLKNQFGINNNGHIGIELTRQDLASFSGAAYESLFRTINDLTDKNLISIAGKHITINNEARLLQMIEEESVS
jgi:CRP/FNR family transcriptional regulator